MTPYERMKWMQRAGVRELPHEKQHPAIQWGFMLCGLGPDQPDELAWCSASMNLAHALEDYPITGSAAARSWLLLGTVIDMVRDARGRFVQAQVGDVLILKRGDGWQPGPEVTSGAPGHVAFFDGFHADGRVLCLGGNQSNAITQAPFPAEHVIGIRRMTR